MSTLAAPVETYRPSYNKRKRSISPSGSPPRKTTRPVIPRIQDVDPVRRQERERQLALKLAEQELNDQAPKDDSKAVNTFDAKAEFAKLTASSGKGGGVYIPPARLRALQAAAAASGDKSSLEYQRMSWDALRKSITGIVNRVNVLNIKQVVPELFSENLIRGRGLFARSVMKAQSASLPYTPVFAALVAIINTKLPQVGELVLNRLVSQFRRAFKRNDKIVCHSTTTFVAHLVNQTVAHELLALQILVLLLERSTDDSVEIAVGFMREVGAFLAENDPKSNNFVFERFRVVLNEGKISQRVQFMVEVLMQVRKDKYKDNPILPEGLDLVPEEDQITHEVILDGDLQVQEGLNIFKFDPNFLDNEEKYRQIKTEILGEDESSDDESGSEESGESEEEPVPEKEGIEDQTGTNLVNLRRTIYLTIMNSLNFEEAVHKLLKINIEEGEEIEMCNMIIECCSQERSYSTFYGLVGERFSKLNRQYTTAFELAFRTYYDTIHRYETNRLRNIARFFGHLLSSDSISWAVLDVIKMNEEDTTSSSRIFVKILCNEMMEEMGLKGLVERFKDPEIKDICKGMFPLDNPKNTRFSINYFTSVGLGAITEEMREHLKNAPRLIMEQRRAMLEEESSSSSSDSDSDISSDSDTESDSDDRVSSVSASSSVASSRPRSRNRHDRRRSPSIPRGRSARSPPPDSRSTAPPYRSRRDSDTRDNHRNRGRSASNPPGRASPRYNHSRRDDERDLSPPRRRDRRYRSPSVEETAPPKRVSPGRGRPRRDDEYDRGSRRERKGIPSPRRADASPPPRPRYHSRRRESPRSPGTPRNDRRERDRKEREREPNVGRSRSRERYDSRR